MNASNLSVRTAMLLRIMSAALLAACSGQAEPTRLATTFTPVSEPSQVPQAAATVLASVSAQQATAQPSPVATQSQARPVVQEYPVPRGSHPHDVAPAPDGTI